MGKTTKRSITKISVERMLETNPHVDGGWFWSKYSANPYLGCQYGCAYCFLRQERYGLSTNSAHAPDASDPFAQNIRVKTNAAEVLDRELVQVPPDIIIVGDYQPIEKQFGISRDLLQVCLNHGFPVMVIAKSPVVLRDIDLLQKIAEQSWACVVFSIGFSESGPQQKLLEPGASSIESRFYAMRKISEAGIYTGTALMPVMPFINDNEVNIRAIVAQTQRQGGRFVLAGGLALGGKMEPRFSRTLHEIGDRLPAQYQRLYRSGFSPNDTSWSRLGRTVRSRCQELGLEHRIKRYIAPGPLAGNKEFAEELFLRVYDLELADSSPSEIARLRQLAWRVDESPSLIDGNSFSFTGFDRVNEHH